MKSIKGKLEEQRSERVKTFMTGAAEQIDPTCCRAARPGRYNY